MDASRYLKATCIFFQITGSLAGMAAGEPKWVTETVDRSTSGNRQVSLKLTPEGKVRVAYTGCSDQKCNSNELFYSVRTTDGKWKSASVDNEQNDAGRYASMTISADNKLHLFYSNNYYNPSLHHAFKSLDNESDPGEGWKKETVGNKPGGFWTSTVSSGDSLYVANTSLPTGDINTTVMQIATLSPQGWALEDIDTSWSTGWFTTMAVGADGLPLTAFTQGGTWPQGDLIFGKKLSTGKWLLTTIDDQSYKPSMAVDNKGFVHMAYTKMDEKYMKPHDLFYATNAPDGEWHSTKIEGGEYQEQDTGLFPNLKLDSKGGIHIIYNDNFHQKVSYARNLGDGWKIYSITRNKQDGYYASMDIDSSGGVHVAYDAGYEIRYIYCANCAVR